MRGGGKSASFAERTVRSRRFASPGRIYASDSYPSAMRRRRLLAAIGAGSVGGLAGCSDAGFESGSEVDGGSGSDGRSGSDDGSGSDGGSGSDDGSGPDDGSDPEPTSEWPSGPYADYDTTVVEARASDGDRLGTVTAAIADTADTRWLGLSDAESLPENGGMLFVYDAPRESLTYVMRRMDFGIDIVYADSEGTIVEIHNAPEPGPNEDGNEQEYPGSGQYVLEVPYKWTDRNGVAVGDALSFEL